MAANDSINGWRATGAAEGFPHFLLFLEIEMSINHTESFASLRDK